MSAWTPLTIRDLGRVVTGKTPPTDNAEYYEGNELFVSPKDLTWNSYYVDLTTTRISEKALDKFKGQVIPKDAVMFTSLSFAFGKLGIASRTCITNQQINSIIVSEKHCARFVYYLLRVYEPFIFAYNSGIDTPIVPKSVFERIPVLVPDKATQEKIASLLSAYDDLIANNQRRIALLESMAEEIYREWFVRKRVARKERRLVRFDELGRFEKGKNPAQIQSSPGEDLLAYLTADVLRGAPASEWVLSNRSVVSGAGEVLMLMDGSNSGEVFRGPAGVVASTAAVIRTTAAHQGIVYQYLRQMQEAIKWNNTGSAVPHANKDFINRMLVPMPVNEKVLTEFNNLHEPLYQQGQALKRMSAKLMLQRDSLLPRLISGKLRVDHLDIQYPPSMKAELAKAA